MRALVSVILTASVLACSTGGGSSLDALEGLESVYVPIDPASMLSLNDAVADKGYGNVTVDDFKRRFTAFGPINSPNDPQVQAALDDAATVADDGWPPLVRSQAVMLKAAHELTLDGVGTSAEAQLAQSGVLGFSAIRSGGFSLERGSSSGGASSSDPTGYSRTSYGQRLQALIRSRFVGVLVV